MVVAAAVEWISARQKQLGASSEAPDRAQFDRFDLDGSGKLTRSEVHAMVSALDFAANEEYLTGLFAKFDTDRNGSIDFQEFLRLWAFLQPSGQFQENTAIAVEPQPELDVATSSLNSMTAALPSVPVDRDDVRRDQINTDTAAAATAENACCAFEADDAEFEDVRSHTTPRPQAAPPQADSNSRAVPVAILESGCVYRVISPAVLRASFELPPPDAVINPSPRVGVLPADILVEPLALVRNADGELRIQVIHEGVPGWVSETARDGTILLQRVEYIHAEGRA